VARSGHVVAHDLGRVLADMAKSCGADTLVTPDRQSWQRNPNA